MEKVKSFWLNKSFKSLRILALIVIALLLLTRYSVWLIVNYSNDQKVKLQLNSIVSDDVNQMDLQLKSYANLLYAGRSFLLSNTSNNRQSWATFIDGLYLNQRYPSIIGVSYVSKISRDQVQSLTNQLNAQRLPNETSSVSIYPTTTNGQLAVITYAAPSDINQSGVGYDLDSSGVRAATLNEASSTGAPWASPPLTLIANQTDKTPSFFIALPVYQANQPISSSSERLSATAGYVVLAFRSELLLDPIFKRSQPYQGLAASVTTDGKVIYRQGADPAKQPVQQSQTVTVGGQIWRLDFGVPMNFGLSTTAKLAPDILILSSVPFAIILFLTFYFAINVSKLRLQLKQ